MVSERGRGRCIWVEIYSFFHSVSGVSIFFFFASHSLNTDPFFCNGIDMHI